MRYLFNGGWIFLETDLSADYASVQAKKDIFKQVELPHDWLIYDSTDLYRDGIGWYSKDFEYDQPEDKRCFITFEGVYMDSEVYVNGTKVFEWKYGYSSFSLELTKNLKQGTNNITVSARYQNPNTRWYSGAGIYRDVWLNITQDTFIPQDGVYISYRPDEDGNYLMQVDTEVCGKEAAKAEVIVDLEGMTLEPFTAPETQECEIPACDMTAIASGEKRYRITNKYIVKNPKKWDIEEPNLYNVAVMLVTGDSVIDEYKTRIGFKDIELDPDRGFIINGRNIKLNGACEHHDLGALGAAFNKNAMKRKLKMLRKMGVNAIRGTHNMVAPQVLELLDEMGFVFISEAFDMWRKSKTTFDYARFFDEWHERDVASWVRRDRNHVCVTFWSIGNEIYDTHADENGAKITKELSDLVRHHDYNGNATPTIGSNYMPWENAQKCADILKIAGYNYAEKYYEEHHKAHPDWVIYGSETSSVVHSRGIYHFPASAGVLSDDDQQCSSLGNSSTSWGAPSVEKCIKADRDIPFSMGQFIWTGFDYIGEPTPYQTKNSYFGQIDTAGFPKDSFYEWQSAWTDHKKAPMVHICPYWDFNEGQTIDIRVFTNAPKARLSINGRDLGEHAFSHKPGSGDQIEWHLSAPFEKGTLIAEALDEDGSVIATDTVSTSGEAKKIVLKAYADQKTLVADGTDMAFVEIAVVDAEGKEVRNAQNRVTVSVSGAGRLVGLDNGDSSDLDSYKINTRRLFSGRLLAIVKSTFDEGKIVLNVTGAGLEGAEIEFEVLPDESASSSAGSINGVAAAPASACIVGGRLCYEKPCIIDGNVSPDSNSSISLTGKEKSDNAASKSERGQGYKVINLGNKDEIPVRKIELVNESDSNVFDKEHPVKTVFAKVLPENASYKDIEFQVVTEYGVTSNIADLTQDGNRVTISAKGDGRFFLRAMSKNGSSEIRLISYMDFAVEGMGAAFLDPYSFVSGSLYSKAEGEVGNGNEKGVATAREKKTVVTFERLDFGRDNGDEITIPIFSLDGGPNRIKLWSAGELLVDEIYEKPPIWNVYQEAVYKLPKKLTGVCDLSIETYDKLHIKGFSFGRNYRGFEEHLAIDADEIYGDTFTKGDSFIADIGNNVSIVFKDMTFGEKAPKQVVINGRAKGGKNTVHILFDSEKGSSREILEIEDSKDICQHVFDVNTIAGSGTITFVFLPGSNFDLESFRFI
ncbi:MAG: DUF4982 domain-containing protein [Butyrivibrio sp.]|nr:DUF4982 domain-containing protein [Butyrivibrio sp.]